MIVKKILGIIWDLNQKFKKTMKNNFNLKKILKIKDHLIKLKQILLIIIYNLNRN